MKVKVAALPGQTRDIELGDNATLHDALVGYYGGEANLAGIGQVRLNNQPVIDGEFQEIPLQSNAIVTIVGRVNGGVSVDVIVGIR